MTWRTARPVVWLRDLGRGIGLNRWMASIGRSGYESSYDEMLSAAIRSGDVVWDVGANVGYYTRRFVSRVGGSGVVFAFEPSPVNFSRLHEACSGMPEARLVQAGLGATSGHVGFHQGEDDLGATSRVSDDERPTERVEIRVGDEEIATGTPQPNVIKIDVEGYEGEVLSGLKHCLKSPSLRAIGVEVHFGILAERGLPSMPRKIEHMLRDSGFKVRWPDSSHLIAMRGVNA